MDGLLFRFEVTGKLRVLGLQFLITLNKPVKVFHIVHCSVNNVFDVLCKAGDRKIGAVICDDFGFIFTCDFNHAKLTLDFWVRFNVVLNFRSIGHTKCRGENEVRVFLVMVGDASSEVVSLSEFDEFFVVGVGVVNGAEINGLSIHWKLADKGFLYGAFLFLGEGDGGLVEGGGGLFELGAEFAGFGIKDLVKGFFHLHVILVDFTGFLGLCFKAEKFEATDGEFDGLLVVAAMFFGFVGTGFVW